MKLKKGFVLREVAGQTLVVATGEASRDFHGMIKLNDTGRFIWEQLLSDRTEKEIVDAICAEYDVDRKFAEEKTAEFLKKIEDAGFFEK